MGATNMREHDNSMRVKRPSCYMYLWRGLRGSIGEGDAMENGRDLHVRVAGQGGIVEGAGDDSFLFLGGLLRALICELVSVVEVEAQVVKRRNRLWHPAYTNNHHNHKQYP